jgi:hypothetical protein
MIEFLLSTNTDQPTRLRRRLVPRDIPVARKGLQGR